MVKNNDIALEKGEEPLVRSFCAIALKDLKGPVDHS